MKQFLEEISYFLEHLKFNTFFDKSNHDNTIFLEVYQIGMVMSSYTSRDET